MCVSVFCCVERCVWAYVVVVLWQSPHLFVKSLQRLTPTHNRYVHAVADAKWMKRNLFFPPFLWSTVRISVRVSIWVSIFGCREFDMHDLRILRLLHKGSVELDLQRHAICIWITVSRYVARTCARFASRSCSMRVSRNGDVEVSIHLTIRSVSLGALWNSDTNRSLKQGIEEDAKRKVKRYFF